jgi:divalent metal cation (Fe/Co/Zn/Cd) transporter
MDASPAEADERARAAVEAFGAGARLRRLRMRESGGRYFADAVVAVPPAQAIVAGHQTADAIEEAIRQALPGSDVVVHLEPEDEDLDLRERALAIALAEPLVREAHDITIYEHDGQASISMHLKMPPNLPLADAHEVAERIEQALRHEPGVFAVQTHLEPLERPRAARPAGSGAAAERQRIQAIVEERTGHPPAELSLLETARGRVVFVSVNVPPDTTLADSHELASRLEDEIRGGQSDLADVVVHTEPAGAGDSHGRPPPA